ncbi:MAG: hypothetical protein ACRDZR_16150 [Acidimicrobiales bacterium]
MGIEAFQQGPTVIGKPSFELFQSTAGAPRGLDQGGSERDLGVGDALNVPDPREAEGCSDRGPSGDLPDGRLVKEEPRLRHPYRDNRHMGLRAGERGHRVRNLLVPQAWVLPLSIPVHHNDVVMAVLIVEVEYGPEPVLDTTAWWLPKATEIRCNDPNSAAMIGEHRLDMGRKGFVRVPVGK